jgi:hypothetical protein
LILLASAHHEYTLANCGFLSHWLFNSV